MRSPRTPAQSVRALTTDSTLLIILDGFGLADAKNPGNVITPKTAPHIFRYLRQYPSTTLTAHGKAVGLFANQEGNSEAGHLTIGAGRVVKQDLVRISETIADGTFFKNEVFAQAVFHAQKYHSAIHLMGLLTDGQSAHAHPDHVYALLEYFRRKKCQPIFLHLFTDGRDSPPHSAVTYIRELRERLQNGERIATVMGRFYAMDRNKMWERTETAYNTLVRGIGNCVARSAEEAVSQAYNRGETDEYICPTVIVEGGKPVITIKNNDVIFFFNARSDRARQLTKVFVQPHFQEENPSAFARRHYPKHTYFVAMTDFGPDLPGIYTAFPSPDISNCLAKAIGDSRRQLYIAETEKYAHVTYFINGGFAAPINGEARELVHSTPHWSYASEPAMKARTITKKVVNYLKHDRYDFVTVNYANADMVGHTGDIEAAKQAIRVLDECVEKVVDAVLKYGWQLLITADHGNAETMIDKKTGESLTEHTTNPVPCILIGKKWKSIRGGFALGGKFRKGTLADVAPTLLKMMGIQTPKEMSGKSLF